MELHVHIKSFSVSCSLGHLEILFSCLCFSLSDIDSPVACAVRTGVVHSHNDENMLKVRANGPGCEGVGSWFLEHNSHNVVPNVTLPQQLENSIYREKHEL